MDPKVWNELHRDFQITIINAVDDYRCLEFLSLVSKQFLSITNQCRRSFTITDDVIPFLPSLLCRFPNIDEINIPSRYFNGDLDLDGLLCQISASNIVLRSITLRKYNPFPVEGLRHLGSKMGSRLRILNCSGMTNFTDHHLVTVASTFPFLEELDISYAYSRVYKEEEQLSMSDAGIRQMSLRLKQLRKINITGNKFLTDDSIISLSSNCLLLQKLEILSCQFTVKGIGMALRDCHHLNSMSAILPPKGFSKSDECFFSKSLSYATNLRELRLDFRNASSSIADGFLSDLTEANLPLEKLKISTEYATYEGISKLLHKYCSLVSLDVQWSGFLIGGQKLADISKFLKNITYIDLSGCFNLTSSAFFTIIGSCPFVSNITMWSTGVGGIEEFDQIDFAVNHRLKNLGLAGGNTKICDEFLKKVAFTCPNLENLDLAGCHSVRTTREGINTVLRNCHQIKHLDISWCVSIRKFSVDIQLPNLQVLRVKDLGLDDKSLEIIGERCGGLLDLDLENCRNVSGNGVMEVVKKCQNLRSINLKGCQGVYSDTIDSLVSLRPSLRKIFHHTRR